ncbi:hypothetical protein ER308_00475 [Egibacter rhizosphaerae]|uniref:Glycosyl hydrolase family 13 catalytic domain-containing protein n=1 Tax=Egibacter rhizosphaerae TaxID=1670831 RepID=A0A411YAG5_9ACTN|nr:alpha-amylase family glycosyl hydrolase [Egibacter rhizosphaerae]QBI18196.1 hypothetical protein ER308_00475 [Egibacter rhizosphaerae]
MGGVDVTGAADRPWWSDAVGYEVYIRSFADGDGDGVGDLHGLADRLDHLAWLGIDIVWISPCYPSPRHDGGYDVADYLRAADDLGGDAALDRVIGGAHDRGMRVVLDLVPNHTSSEHPWFQRARRSRDAPERSRYLWRDGATPGPPEQGGTPPNNWVSHFGGPAWSYDRVTDQWWCHLFLPEQPDLDWSDPEVSAAFEEILESWFARGVDGFRIDVAHGLVKHPDLPDLPPATGPDRVDPAEAANPVDPAEAANPIDPDDPLDAHDQLDHRYDVNQEGVRDVYRRWRRIADRHGALLLGEVYLLDPEQLSPYLSGDGLHLAFWFGSVHTEWDAAAVRGVLRRGADVAPGHVAWIIGSHDVSRAPTRFGGGDIGRRRALALATLQFCLPGVPFVYQGDELGLEDVAVPPERADDPIVTRAGVTARSRDVCRTPMPWAPGPGLGFSGAADPSPEPWLPMGPRRDTDTVSVQREDPDSLLHRWRALVALRHSEPALVEAPVEWLTEEGPVIAFRRGPLITVANAGSVAETWAPPGQSSAWVLAFDAAGRGDGQRLTGPLELAPADAVVLRSDEHS